MIVASIILVSVSVSLALLLGKSWTLLLMLVVVCGVIKVPLASMTHVSALLLIDGIPAILMILSAMVLAFKGEGADSRALGLYLVLALLVALAVFRAPSAFQVGVQQAQQVLVPVGLVPPDAPEASTCKRVTPAGTV